MKCIAKLRSNKKNTYEASQQASLETSKEIALVQFIDFPNWQECTRGLEKFSHIWLIYEFHQNENWKSTVHPPRAPHLSLGVFATRSPHRPNSIGMSVVKLERIDTKGIWITGFDLLDQSPILDIKPYIPYADSIIEANSGWLDEENIQEFQIHFSALAQSQLVYLSPRLSELKSFIFNQLRFEPINKKLKRVKEIFDTQNSHKQTDIQIDKQIEAFNATPNNIQADTCTTKDIVMQINKQYEIAYRTWRILFEMDANANMIQILKIYSGYSAEDLNSNSESYKDKYLDKDLHKSFNLYFDSFQK